VSVPEEYRGTNICRKAILASIIYFFYNN
jgi:hypothetical protein